MQKEAFKETCAFLQSPGVIRTQQKTLMSFFGQVRLEINSTLQSKNVIVFNLPSFNLDTGWTAAKWADTTEYEYYTSTSSVLCIFRKHFVY